MRKESEDVIVNWTPPVNNPETFADKGTRAQKCAGSLPAVHDCGISVSMQPLASVVHSASGLRIRIKPPATSLRPQSLGQHALSNNVKGKDVVAQKKVVDITSSQPQSHTSAASTQPQWQQLKPHLKEKRRAMRKEYEDVIVNWTPPVNNLPDSDDSEDWLFADKGTGAQKRTGSLPAVRDCGSSVSMQPLAQKNAASPPAMPDCKGTVFPMQPHAQYLPELDIWALPYVVPF